MTLRTCPAPDPRLDPARIAKEILTFDFREGAQAIWLGRANYGCLATVLPTANLGLDNEVR